MMLRIIAEIALGLAALVAVLGYLAYRELKPEVAEATDLGYGDLSCSAHCYPVAGMECAEDCTLCDREVEEQREDLSA